jgi:type II secretory pathway pseudopilin PulG
MTTSSRHGFKLVELVVVLAIIAMAGMLFLAFASHSRVQVCRPASTHNNLRMCAIAIHNYHATYNRLPGASWRGGLYTEPRSMWFQLLPYVEQDNVYKNNVHNALISAYMAPEDPHVAVVDGKLNFAANIRLFGHATLGKGVADNAVDAVGAPTGAGLAFDLRETMKSGLSLARIADGTSNVLMLTTRYADCGPLQAHTYYSASPVGTLLTAGGPERAPSVGIPTGLTRGGFFGAGAHDRPADAGSIDAIYQIAPTPEKCRSDNAVFGHSFRPGGLIVARADASLWNIMPTMSPTTFCRAMCPGDGHVLSDDWVGE